MQPSGSPPQPSSRRGPPLAVQTDFPLQQPTRTTSTHFPIPTQGEPLRTRPLETAYARHADHRDTSPAAPHAPRRQSKLNFKLFTRNKSTRRTDGLEATDEEPERSSPEHADDEAPGRPALAARPDTLREMPSTQRTRSKKDKTQPPVAANDPPPLFQAYPQAVKEAHLMAPAVDAETVLRLNRTRQLSDPEAGDPTATTDFEGSPVPETTKELRKKINKRRTSTLPTIACVPKIYLLTTSGLLLQYAQDGCYNRVPERIMQLRKDSAAFASDAIPGKHWVLQICQSSTADGGILEAPKPSVFSKLSFGNDMKKPVSNFLIVMNSADEMNSWLVTMRKEIQSLGGREYRPDEHASTEVSRPPPPRTMGSMDGELWGRFSRAPGARPPLQRASMYMLRSPPGGGMPPIAFPQPRPELGSRKISTGSVLSHRNSMYAISPTHPVQAMQPDWLPLRADLGTKKPLPRGSPPTATSNLDKALPERPVDDTQARIDALGIINAEQQRQARVGVEVEVPLSPHSTNHPVRSPLSPKLPFSAFHPDARKFSSDSPRPSVDGIRHHPFSFEKANQAGFSPTQPTGPTARERADASPPQPISRASHDTTASGRTHTTTSTAPSLTDGESAPQESLPGDIPAKEHPAARLMVHTGAPATAPSGSSPTTVRIEVQQTPRADSSQSQRPSEGTRSRESHESERGSVAPKTSPRAMNVPVQEPKRAGLVEHASAPAPKPGIHLQPSGPYPLPNSSLPALPLGTAPPMRPSSAQDNAKRSISPMPTGKGLRRPTSFQVTSPSCLSTPTITASGLPMAQPLTIQERRRLSHRPVMVMGPPMHPPPQSPLPQLPKTAGASAFHGPPTPPPFKEMAPSLPTAQFPRPPRRLPDSLHALTAKPTDDAPSGQLRIVNNGGDVSQAQLSPASESWKLYLDRIGHP